MRTQNKPFVVEIKKAKRATDAPAETPAPRGAAPSSSIWSSVPEPSQPPLTASAARRAADALFDFTPKTPAPKTSRAKCSRARGCRAQGSRALGAGCPQRPPLVHAAPEPEELPASPVTPSPKGRVLWVERPEPVAAAVDESLEAAPVRRGRGRPRKIVVPADAEAPAVKRPRVAKPGARPVGRPRRVVAPAMVEPAPVPVQAPVQMVPLQRSVRRLRTAELPRGERWKNRLSKFCR